MGVSNELARPDSDDDFEAMCHALYRRMWNDTSCARALAEKGKLNSSVDILGHDGKTSVGIQCKHYPKKPFTLWAVTYDVTLNTTCGPAVRSLERERRSESMWPASEELEWQEGVGKPQSIHSSVAPIAAQETAIE